MLTAEEATTFKEKLAPPIKLQVEVKSAKGKVTDKGREAIDLRLKVIDTIPAGKEIPEEFTDVVDEESQFFHTIYLPKSEEKDGTKKEQRAYSFLMTMFQDFNKYFEIELPEGELTGKTVAPAYRDTCGGVKLKHVAYERDVKIKNGIAYSKDGAEIGPASEQKMKAEVDKAVAVI